MKFANGGLTALGTAFCGTLWRDWDSASTLNIPQPRTSLLSQQHHQSSSLHPRVGETSVAPISLSSSSTQSSQDTPQLWLSPQPLPPLLVPADAFRPTSSRSNDLWCETYDNQSSHDSQLTAFNQLLPDNSLYDSNWHTNANFDAFDHLAFDASADLGVALGADIIPDASHDWHSAQSYNILPTDFFPTVSLDLQDSTLALQQTASSQSWDSCNGMVNNAAFMTNIPSTDELNKNDTGMSLTIRLPYAPSYNNTARSTQYTFIQPSKHGSSRSSSHESRTSNTSKHPASPTSKVAKRTLNTLAARRYRQKRLDHIAFLEAELKQAQDERDALKVNVARLEGETKLLTELLARKGS
jgi:hypothetical protein